MEWYLSTIEGERTQGAFCNPVTKWRYRVAVSKRGNGLISEKMYDSRCKAHSAGKRIIKQLQK